MLISTQAPHVHCVACTLIVSPGPQALVLCIVPRHDLRHEKHKRQHKLINVTHQLQNKAT